MRLRFAEKVDKQTILDNIAEMLNEFSDAGIEEFYGVNLYLNPVHKSTRTSVIINNDKQNGDTVTINGKSLDSKSPSVTELSPKNINKRSNTVKLTIPNVEREKKAQQILDTKRQLFAERLETRNNERIKENECRQLLLTILGCSIQEFNKNTNNRSWLRTRKGIGKYTNKDIGEKVYRIAVKKICGSNDVYLFPWDDINNYIQIENFT